MEKGWCTARKKMCDFGGRGATLGRVRGRAPVPAWGHGTRLPCGPGPRVSSRIPPRFRAYAVPPKQVSPLESMLRIAVLVGAAFSVGVGPIEVFA